MFKFFNQHQGFKFLFRGKYIFIKDTCVNLNLKQNALIPIDSKVIQSFLLKISTKKSVF